MTTKTAVDRGRPRCNKDEYVYYTFWPILAFSFFVASDEIVSAERFEIYAVEPTIMALILFTRTIIHMLAINCLCLSILETFLAFQYLEAPLCTRLFFVEFDAAVAAFFLLVLSLLSIIESIGDPERVGMVLAGATRFIVQFVPWLFGVLLLIYQSFRIITHHRV